MPGKSLIDSGPIIALFNADDQYFSISRDSLKNYRGNLITTWPVITEAIYMLSFSIAAQSALLEWIERGGISVENLIPEDLKYIKSRMKKYSDLPMDLADASLMCLAERLSVTAIFSIDSDFSIYRTLQGKQLNNLIKIRRRRNGRIT